MTATPLSRVMGILGQRLVQALVVALLVAGLCFLMVQSLPGDIAFRIAAGRYGYDYVTAEAANRVPFPRPANYDPRRYEILARIIDAYPGIRFEKLVYLGPLPNGKFDANASGLVQGTDHVGANADYAEGDYATRDRIWQDHVAYVQGFFWFLANDPRVPAELRAQANRWGLARDEFTDNAHWPYALYVREARRMRGAFVMKEENLRREARVDAGHPVAIGSYALDSHVVSTFVDTDGRVRLEGSHLVSRAIRPYGISYYSLVPQKTECTNLLVPICLSATHVTYTSIRMEPVYMVLGQAAGTAAALAIDAKVAVQDISYPQLQSKLTAAGQVLTVPQ